MKKTFCPLGSGSKGNCLFVGTENTKILVDAGFSAKVTQERLARIGVDLGEIQAILISHDHSDHILGLKTLALRLGIPVLANAETAKGIYATFHECPKFKIFTTGEKFVFGDLEIHPFSVQHDSRDPVAFTITIGGKKIGICTDLGFPTTLVKNHLKGCHYLYVESNHEPAMVHACSRPLVYKHRVLGRSGHLSNAACGELLHELLHPELRHIHLAHLSQECNSPQKALEVVREKLGAAGTQFPISIALQDQTCNPLIF